MLRSLRARLTVLMIVMVLLPLILVGTVLTLRAQNVQRDQTREIESAKAASIAANVEALLEGKTQELTMLADVHGLAALPFEEQQVALSGLMAYDPNLEEVAILNRSGRETIRINRDGIVPPESLNFRLTSSEYLITTRNREAYYSPVDMSSTPGTPLMTIAVPAFKPGTQSVDFALVGVFRVDEIWTLLAEGEHGAEHQAFIVDGAGRVVAHQDPQVVLDGTRFTLSDELSSSFLGETTGLSGDEVVMATLPIHFGDQTLTIVTEHSTADALRPARDTRNFMLLAGLAASILTALAAGYLLTRLIRPLNALAESAHRLGSGDFSVRASERGGSELAAVARSFNDMASQLAGTVDTLEQSVSARTSDLQLASQLSNQISTLLDPNELLPQVVELTKSNFNLYHSHIYLLDERSQFLVLTAGAGEAGRMMRARGHRITTHANSLVARAARENTPVVVHDVEQDANFMPNPLLPDTRSEAAFPLAVGGRVVGVLDVQSEQVGRFDANLQTVLQTMSGQIAVAIANAQLFSESERSSRHDRTLSTITDAIQRATTIDDVLQTAARELGKALQVSRTAVELKLPAAGAPPDAKAQTQAVQD